MSDMHGASNAPKSDIAPNIQRILNTIKTRESGDYTNNSHPGGASGAYQFEPGTWRGVATSAGYGQYANTPAFEAPPQVQDAVAAWYVQQILDQNGGDVSKIPLVWYTGNPQGTISASALAANNGLEPSVYQQQWMATYTSGGGDPGSYVPPDTSSQTPAAPNAPSFDAKNPVPDNPTLDKEIATNFPEYAWAFADPELGPILRYAATYNENAAWVQAQVQGTGWWKQHSDTGRQWQMLQQTDPGEALQQMHNKAAQVMQQAGQIGLTVAPDRANQLAQESLQFGWNPEQMQQALYAEYQRVSGGGQALGVTVAQTGSADTYAQQATQMAHEYLSNLTPQQATQIGMQIATGQMDPNALSSMFVGQAKARFKDNPDLLQALDSGITPAQVLSPYQQTIGNLLEVSPDQINFSDPKYAAILSTTDQRGSNRLMTETEAANWARGQPEWTRTQNAHQAASQTAQQVLSDMGAARY